MEPTTVRVAPEDFDIIYVVQSGIEETEMEEALAEIDGWRLRLEVSADPEILSVAEDLGRLGDLLRSCTPDPAEAGRGLSALGGRLRSSDVARIARLLGVNLDRLSGLLGEGAGVRAHVTFESGEPGTSGTRNANGLGKGPPAGEYKKPPIPPKPSRSA